MKKIIFTSFLIIVSFIFLFNSENIAARNLKAFVVEKSGSGAILISDGYSQYIIDHSYSCYDSQFIEGSTIYIDTYYSPSYGNDIIISGYTNTVCEVTDSDNVNIKQYYVDNVFDSEDKIIVSNSSGKYLVEYGIGCGLSMWRYEGKKIDIDIGGAFLDGISDTIYLFDSGRDCRVWDAEELSGGSSGSYSPPSSPSKTCPINSSLVGTGCVCNSGYVTDSTKTYCIAQLPSCQANSSLVGNSCVCNEGYSTSGSGCITYNQACQNTYGINSYGDKSNCWCNVGYQWNSSKTACVNIVCPINSSLSGNQCLCNNGYVNNTNGCITNTQDCINIFGQNVHGTPGDKNNSSCDCNDGYTWNNSQTGCIKATSEIVSSPEPVKTINPLPTNTAVEQKVSQHNSADNKNVQLSEDSKPDNTQSNEGGGFMKSVSGFFTNIIKSIGSFFKKIF